MVFALGLKRNRLSNKLINENFVEAWQCDLHKYLCKHQASVCGYTLSVCPVAACIWPLQRKWKRVKRSNCCRQLLSTFWGWNYYRVEISQGYWSAVTPSKKCKSELRHKTLTNSISIQSLLGQSPWVSTNCVARSQGDSSAKNNLWLKLFEFYERVNYNQNQERVKFVAFLGK